MALQTNSDFSNAASRRLRPALAQRGTVSEDEAERRERFACDSGSFCNESSSSLRIESSDIAEKALTEFHPSCPKPRSSSSTYRRSFRRLGNLGHGRIVKNTLEEFTPSRPKSRSPSCTYRRNFRGLARLEQDDIAGASDEQTVEVLDLDRCTPVVAGAASILRAVHQARGPAGEDEDALPELSAAFACTSVRRPSPRRPLVSSPLLRRATYQPEVGANTDDLKSVPQAPRTCTLLDLATADTSLVRSEMSTCSS